MNNESWPCPNKDLLYDKGENRRKHLGRCDEAEMAYEKGGNWVGKCPRKFSQDVAQQLIEYGIPEFRETMPDRPCRLWTYHDGVVYVARSQDGGKTWHGFPNGHPMKEPPRAILRQLEQRAQACGEEARIHEWLDKRWDEKK